MLNNLLDEVIETKNLHDEMVLELMEDDVESQQNEMLEIMHFIKMNGVPLTSEQTKAIYLLNDMGIADIALYANKMRSELTPIKKFFTLIDKFTLADRIKGHAKLKDVLKASVTNPNANMPNMKDYQAQALRESELKR